MLTILPHFAVYSETLYATYASFGGGRSLIDVVLAADPQALVPPGAFASGLTTPDPEPQFNLTFP